MRSRLRILPHVLILGITGGHLVHAADGDAPSFRRDIAPVLADRCVTCHGIAKQRGGYRADSYRYLLEQGESGKLPIIPGDPSKSRLFRLVSTTDAEDRMPQKGEPFDGPTLELIRRWIAAGATFDGTDPGQSLADLMDADSPAVPPAVYAHPIPLLTVAFAAERTLIVGGYHEAIVWTAEGDLVRRIPGLPERVHSLVLHPNGRQLFFAGGTPGRSGVAGLIDLENQGSPKVLARAADEMLSIAVNEDASRIAIAGTDSGISILDGTDDRRLFACSGHADWVIDLTFSRDGQRLASASRDRTARVFDAGTGTMVSAFRDHGEAVTAVTFLRRGERAATGGRDGCIRIWDTRTASQLKVSKVVRSEPTHLLARGDRIWAAWLDGVVREYREADLQVVREFGPPGERVLGMAEDPVSPMLAATAFDGQLRLWSLEDAHPIAGFQAFPRAP